MPFDLHHLASYTDLYQPQLRGLEVEKPYKTATVVRASPWSTQLVEAYFEWWDG